MPKHPSGKSERKTPIGQRKAGKGARPFTAPPAANPDRADARTAGERQFNLRRPATVEVANLLGKLEAITVPFAWDAARKRILFSPRKEAKE